MDKQKINVSVEEIDKQYQEIQKEKEEKVAKQASNTKFEFDPKRYFDSKIEGDKVMERETVIRFLPFFPNEGKLFQRLKMHSIRVPADISKYGVKSYICLENNPTLVNAEQYGTECPICQLIRNAKDAERKATTKEEREAYNSVAWKNRASDYFMCRIIERGHEEDGPKFWKFPASSKGDGIYDKIMQLYRKRNKESIEATGEPYNIFDLYDGKDITVTIKKNEKGIHSYLFVDSGFKSPLSKDEKKIEKWVFDPMVWTQAYTIKSADYLSILLEGKTPVWDKDDSKWVSKEGDEEDEAEVNDENNITETSFKVPDTYNDFDENKKDDLGKRINLDSDDGYEDLPF